MDQLLISLQTSHQQSKDVLKVPNRLFLSVTGLALKLRRLAHSLAARGRARSGAADAGPSLTCLPSAGGLINHSLSDVCYGLPAVIMGWTFEADDGVNPSYFSEIIPEHNLFRLFPFPVKLFTRSLVPDSHQHLGSFEASERLKQFRSV